MEYHEIANIFPMMSVDEYAVLKEDIAINGLIEPIVIYEGKILDGRNRYKACNELGITPIYREWIGECGMPLGFVISENLSRRHLTSSQKAIIALAIEEQLANKNPRGRPEKNVQKIEHFRASEKAAAIIGTNRQYIVDAKKIQTSSPGLAEKIRSGEMTIPEAKKELRRFERIEQIIEISKNNTPLNGGLGKFNVIYADPPWEYEYSKSDNRVIENHYPTMPLEDIEALPVQDITADDCILFLWVTSPKLVEGMQLLESWGFRYRTNLVWVKDKIGMGYYFRQMHELLLVGTRGQLPVPLPEDRHASVLSSPRKEHSQKPEEIYKIIERMYPDYPKIELFSRLQREGWKAWGNQI